MFVSESTANRVVRFARKTRMRAVVASAGLDQPLGIALQADGSLLVCDGHHGRVVRVGAHGALVAVLAGLSLPVAVTAGAGGIAYVVDHVQRGASGTILRLHPGGRADTLSAGKIESLSGVVAAPGGVLYVTSFEPPFVGTLAASGALRPFG